MGADPVMKVVRYVLPITLPVVALSACGVVEPYGCTAMLVPGIVVEIHDIATGRPLAAGARGAVQDQDFVDSLVPYGFGDASPESMFSRQAAFERHGTYRVHIEVAGYYPYDTTGVQVRQARCHVETAHLKARLTSSP